MLPFDLHFKMSEFFIFQSVKVNKNKYKCHKHSVMYTVKEECELKKHKLFYQVYISEVKQSRNRRIAFFIAV